MFLIMFYEAWKSGVAFFSTGDDVGGGGSLYLMYLFLGAKRPLQIIIFPSISVYVCACLYVGYDC